MQCKDVMLSLVWSCRPDTSAAACAVLMREQHIGFVPVIDENRALVGVVTDRDLVLKLVAQSLAATTPIAELMSTGPFLICRPDENLRSLERRMAAEQRSRAVVQNEQGKVVGIISLSDIAQAERSASRTGKLLREIARRESAMIARP